MSEKQNVLKYSYSPKKHKVVTEVVEVSAEEAAALTKPVPVQKSVLDTHSNRYKNVLTVVTKSEADAIDEMEKATKIRPLKKEEEIENENNTEKGE